MVPGGLLKGLGRQELELLGVPNRLLLADGYIPEEVSEDSIPDMYTDGDNATATTGSATLRTLHAFSLYNMDTATPAPLESLDEEGRAENIVAFGTLLVPEKGNGYKTRGSGSPSSSPRGAGRKRRLDEMAGGQEAPGTMGGEASGVEAGQSSGEGKEEELTGLRVRLDGIKGWCIDYAGPRAVLWLITKSGSWYRLADLQSPHLKPHPGYASVFSTAARKFHCCAVAANCLAGLTPDKASYSAVLAMTGLTENDVLEDAGFIAMHMGELKGADGELLGHAHSGFVEVLRQKGQMTDGTGWMKCGEAIHEASTALREAVARWVMEARGGGANGSGTPRSPSPSRAKFKALNDSEEEEDDGDEEDGEDDEDEDDDDYGDEDSYEEGEEGRRPVLIEEPPPPLEDLDILGLNAQIPRPQPLRPISMVLPSHLFNSILVSWNTITMCGPNLLRLAAFPLDSLEHAVANHTRGLCPTLYQECVCRLLTIIVRDRCKPTAIVSAMSVEEGGDEDDKEASRPVETLESIFYGANKPGATSQQLEELIPQSWQELARFLIAEQYGIPLESYLDVLGESKRLIDDLISNKSAIDFTVAVDPVRDEMPDYWTIIEHPMDLGTIAQRLRAGWYEPASPLDPLPTFSTESTTSPSDDKSFQPGSTTSTSSRGRGHVGVLEDVRLVWANCEKYHGPDSVYTETAKDLSDDFEDKFKRRVLIPLDKREAARSQVGGNAQQLQGEVPWPEVVDQLGLLEYKDLPVATRVQVLRWLCDEVVSTAPVRDLLDKVMDAKERMKKLAPKRKVYLSYMESKSIHSREGDNAAALVATQNGAIPTWSNAEENDFQIASQLADNNIRLAPVGTDRHRRRYWVFPRDNMYRIFTEDMEGQGVTVSYGNQHEVMMLMNWLAPNTPREGRLRADLMEAVGRYYDDNVPKMMNDGRQFITYNSPTAGRYLQSEFGRSIIMKAYLPAREKHTLGLVPANGDFLINTFRDSQHHALHNPTNRRIFLQLQDRVVMIQHEMCDGLVNWPPVSQKLPGIMGPPFVQPHFLPEEYFTLTVLRESHDNVVDVRTLPQEYGDLNEWAFIQGWLLYIEREIGHPVALGRDWAMKRKEWRRKVSTAQSPQEVKEAILQLEAALAERGTVLMDEWTAGPSSMSWRRGSGGLAVSLRVKWRQYLGQATTSHQVMLALRSLRRVLDLRALQRALSPLERHQWLDLLQPNFRIEPPNLGQVVLYFHEGLEAAAAYDSNFRGTMWGLDNPPPPRVLPMLVQDLEYFSLTPSKDVSRLSAWARLRIAPLHWQRCPFTTPSFRLLPPANHRATLSRLLSRIMRIVLTMPEADQFITPVSRRDYPDYYDIVTSPIDLGTIISKVRSMEYGSVAAFDEDVTRLGANCHLYCETRFPHIPPLVDLVVGQAKQQLKRLAEELKAAEGNITQKEQVKNEGVPVMAMVAPPPPAPPSTMMTGGGQAMMAAAASSIPYPAPVMYPTASCPTPAPIPPPYIVPTLHAMPQQVPFYPSHIPWDATIKDFYILGMWLSNSVPEYLVTQRRYEESMRREWRQEQRVYMTIYPPEMSTSTSARKAEIKEGYIVGCKEVDRETGLMPWACLEVEWEGSAEETTSFVNPWELQVVNEEDLLLQGNKKAAKAKKAKKEMANVVTSSRTRKGPRVRYDILAEGSNVDIE